MKVLFICEHNLGRSQIARAFYNYFTDTEDAMSAGAEAEMYPAKTLGEIARETGRETRTMKLMREVGLDLTNAPRQMLTQKLARDCPRIVSFLSREDLPLWLQNDKRLEIWTVRNYPARSLAAARRQRDEIAEMVREMLK